MGQVDGVLGRLGGMLGLDGLSRGGGNHLDLEVYGSYISSSVLYTCRIQEPVNWFLCDD